MAGALPHENNRGVINGGYGRSPWVRDPPLLLKIRLIDGRRAQQSRYSRGDAAHLIVVPDVGRRLAAVYFSDMLQELILVGIIEFSQAFQVKLRRAGLSRPERDLPAVRIEFKVQRGQQE